MFYRSSNARSMIPNGVMCTEVLELTMKQESKLSKTKHVFLYITPSQMQRYAKYIQ